MLSGKTYCFLLECVALSGGLLSVIGLALDRLPLASLTIKWSARDADTSQA